MHFMGLFWLAVSYQLCNLQKRLFIFAISGWEDRADTDSAVLPDDGADHAAVQIHGAPLWLSRDSAKAGGEDGQYEWQEISPEIWWKWVPFPFPDTQHPVLSVMCNGSTGQPHILIYWLAVVGLQLQSYTKHEWSYFHGFRFKSSTCQNILVQLFSFGSQELYFQALSSIDGEGEKLDESFTIESPD